MDDLKLRAWWSYQQALDGRRQGEPAASILVKTGWARSVAGAGPYLTLFSRAGIGRASADQSVANLEIHELPAARGCTYVVPAEDFALALKIGHAFGDAEMKVAAKLGVTPKEVDELNSAVLQALAEGPLDTDQIRERAGSAARSLGEEGKKKGLTTTLPLALGELQSRGEIRRVPLNGRLDQQRYRYTLWKPNPVAACKLSIEEAHVELARRYFSWIGPASLAGFQTFSGFTVKAAKAAIEPLHVAPLSAGDPRLMLPEDRDRFDAFEMPKKPQYSLVSSLDGLILLLQEQVPNHAIFDRGRLVGLWEFDPAANEIVWKTDQKADAGLKNTVEMTQEYIRNELGDARHASLDSPKSRIPRIEALRSAAKK